MNKTLQRVLVGLVALSVFAAPFVTGAALANICGIQVGYWRVTGFPTFKNGSQKAIDYEVDGSSPNNIMVTNGTAIMLSTDSACSWKQVFQLPDTPTAESQATAANSVIKTIDISEVKRGRVLLMVEEQTALGARPHVVRSEDMGATWATGDVGLPPQGSPEALVLPRSSADVAYLATDVGGGSIDFMFASSDGGATWTLRSNPVSLTPSMGISGFTVDPLVGDSLWAWGTGGLYHSVDGGASFTAEPDFIDRAVSTVDIFHSGSKPARLGGFIPAEALVLVSTNGGNEWLSLGTPVGVDTSAHGNVGTKAYITAGGQAYAFHAPTSGWSNLQSPVAGVTDVSTDRAGIVYVRTSSLLLAYDGPDPDPGDEPGSVFQPGQIDPPREFQEHQPTLTPNDNKIVLGPGGTKTVRYDLALSKTPLPVNVFFLLDTSDSMGTTIGDLATSVVEITNLLNKENFALEVGIGAFRAFSDHFPPRQPCGGQTVPGQACEANYIYKRVLDIAPQSQAISVALKTLESDAGGFYKSHLQALYTLATGFEVDDFPPGSSTGDVPSGQGATFDLEAYRVVINATDEEFWKGEPRTGGGTDFGRPNPPETPLFDKVEAALDAKQIYQVGLSIGPAPRKDLANVARRTDALAPAGGVDCGKGHFLEEGDPLVCPVSRNTLTESHNLVPAIVNLIENLPAGVDVAYEVNGNPRVVRRVTPDGQGDVVLQVANDLGFEVTYHCPLDLAGKKFDVHLGATNLQDADLLDEADTQVVCSEKPDPALVPPIVAVSLVALAIPPPPPPPPPAQLTSASQAQSQAQAQTGAAFEEEKEPQLAIAAAYREAAQMENDYDYEMVAYEGRKQPVSPYLTLGAGAMMASLAYGALMIHRTRQNRRIALQHQNRRR